MITMEWYDMQRLKNEHKQSPIYAQGQIRDYFLFNCNNKPNSLISKLISEDRKKKMVEKEMIDFLTPLFDNMCAQKLETEKNKSLFSEDIFIERNIEQMNNWRKQYTENPAFIGSPEAIISKYYVEYLHRRLTQITGRVENNTIDKIISEMIPQYVGIKSKTELSNLFYTYQTMDKINWVGSYDMLASTINKWYKEGFIRLPAGMTTKNFILKNFKIKEKSINEGSLNNAFTKYGNLGG